MLKEAGHESEIAHASSLFAPIAGHDAYGMADFNRIVLNPQGVSAIYGKAAYDFVRLCDAVVIERSVWKESHITIKWLQSIGKRVFCSFDDRYWVMPLKGAVKDKDKGVLGIQGNWRGGKNVRGGEGSLLYQFRDGLRLCDGALVTSEAIRQDTLPYQPNTQIVPNYLYGKLWENLPKPQPDSIVIGWGGTSHHESAWLDSGVIGALGKLCRKYPKIIVHLQPPYPEIVTAFRKLGVRYRIGNWQMFQEWPKTVSQFNIGLAPLSGGKYDEARSNLKVLEYATAGVPWIATDDAPYKDTCGGTLVRNKSEEWYRAIEEMISNLTLYNNKREEGLEWSKSFNGRCIEKYMEVFNG